LDLGLSSLREMGLDNLADRIKILQCILVLKEECNLVPDATTPFNSLSRPFMSQETFQDEPEIGSTSFSKLNSSDFTIADYYSDDTNELDKELDKEFALLNTTDAKSLELYQTRQNENLEMDDLCQLEKLNMDSMENECKSEISEKVVTDLAIDTRFHDSVSIQVY
jgi:hypothetical protein